MDIKFGAPKKFLMDNDLEFSNNEIIEVGEKFNIRIMNTAAYSPFSNGLYERTNSILGIIVSRLVEDDITDVDVALDWAVRARILYRILKDFLLTIYFLVLTRIIHHWMFNMLPPIKPETQSETVKRNLNVLHSARCEYMKNE
ncbi:unnamed protein product [Lepeophtheirus salmonis]|uniref:(salmon louse) hypothetical protein n=1 Tax=Lepeophtheirus salmonis TaxID=72036 RepID=A0A7R8D5Z1_LEPSM|nr:unnamed protein product [Lepeophtheirus salmonis]CAF3040257.1 unnamed protein product [Lepeophtheirus salmonis]